MYQGKKVVCITPAGRQRYLSILQHYVRRDFGLIDEWHLWVNTGNPDDLAYLKDLAWGNFQIRLIHSPDNGSFCSGRIGSFLKDAIDPDTIYVRFDDDVVWVEEGAIQRLIDYKLENPGLFLVGGNVVNNPVCTYRQRLMPQSNAVTDAYDDTVGLSLIHQQVAHHTFLNEVVKENYYFPNEILPLGKRFGIHFICWEGARFAKFEGVIPTIDEEQWLTRQAPLSFGESTGLCGNALAVHFAYTSQRLETGPTGYDYPDQDQDFLERYRKLLP